MRTIVTGGAGFIGSHIADAFLEEGHEVLVIDDLSKGDISNVPKSAIFIQADIRDENEIRRIFHDFKPNIVCHQAAQSSVAVSTREPSCDAGINIIGSLNVIIEGIRSGIDRFIFASTGGAIYGEIPAGERANIDWKPSPRSPYACAKLAVENYLQSFNQEYNLQYNILRYSNVYGPRQNPHGEAGVVAIFAQRLLNSQSIIINAKKKIGDTGCIRDYIYVEDVVRANLCAAKGRLTHSIINVCTGIPTTTSELVKVLENVIETKASIQYAQHRPGDLRYSVLEGNHQELMSALVPLEDGIIKTVKWFKG